jgi:hypothetical protein
LGDSVETRKNRDKKQARGSIPSSQPKRPACWTKPRFIIKSPFCSPRIVYGRTVQATFGDKKSHLALSLSQCRPTFQSSSAHLSLRRTFLIPAHRPRKHEPIVICPLALPLRLRPPSLQWKAERRKETRDNAGMREQ